MPSYTVLVTGTGQPPKQFVVTAPRAKVGRETGDIVVGDPRCSGAHAELLWDGAQVTYRDLDSTNGSFHFGQRVQQLQFPLGTSIRIGDASLQLIAIDPGPAPRRSSAAPLAMTQLPPAKPPPAPVERAASAKPRTSVRPVALALGAGFVVLVVGLGALAVVLSRDVSGNSPSRAATGSMVVAAGGEVTVKAVWFRGQPGVKVEGGTADISVRVAPNKQPGASVGVIEEFSGGTGNQWRTASWLAAFNASRAAGGSLIDHEYLVRAGGHIDGPSAGMLMTATMLALLRGSSPLPGTTMTGTINPDGSAGPVGGIVQKMQGAKESGITRFGFPLGARNHTDLSNMRQVDLAAVGKELGLEVREIDDLDEAYEFLTGDRLERPQPISESELELDTDTTQRMRAKLMAWKARLNGEIAQLKESMRKSPMIAKAMGPQLALISKIVQRAETYERGDFPAAALQYNVKAALFTAMARQGIAFTDSFLSGDLAGIDAQVTQASAVGGLVNAYGEELLVKARRQTVGGQVNTTLAMGAYVTASNFARLGQDGRERAHQALTAIKAGKLRPTAEALGYVSRNLMMPIAYFHCARVMLDLSRDYQDLLGEEGQTSTANLEHLGREAGAYGSAAGAALSYFDALITEDLQQRKGLTKAQAQGAVADKELGYLLARQSTALTENIRAGEKDGTRNLLRLAAGANAYFPAASLVNKYYALGATEDASGEVTLTHRKSLVAQLEQARLHAREAASRAKEVAGFVPVAARLDYQLATAMRDGSDSEKLEALESYWASAFWSELAARLATH